MTLDTNVTSELVVPIWPVSLRRGGMAELWTSEQVSEWLSQLPNYDDQAYNILDGINGVDLLAITDRDFYAEPFSSRMQVTFRLRFRSELKKLQRQSRAAMIELALEPEPPAPPATAVCSCDPDEDLDCEGEPHESKATTEDGRASKLKPEIWKAFLSLCE